MRRSNKIGGHDCGDRLIEVGMKLDVACCNHANQLRAKGPVLYFKQVPLVLSRMIMYIRRMLDNTRIRKFVHDSPSQLSCCG